MIKGQQSQKSFFTFKALESQRSSGYRSTAYALAELIDNAFDAEARHVKVVFLEKRDEQGRKFINEILVCDDGDGMSKDMVEDCLIFGKSGHGTIEEIVKSKKKGKFGYGLPNASLSQCPSVYVYSWQKKGKVFTSYLDLEELRKHNSIFVPNLESVSLPSHYLQTDAILNENHGTIVSWRKCDRLSNARAKTLIEKSTEVLGRLYRYLIRDGSSISMEVWEHNPTQNTFSRTHLSKVLINDPLYLTTGGYIDSIIKKGAIETHMPYASCLSKFVNSDGTCKPTNHELEDHCHVWVFEWHRSKYKFEITTSYADIDIQKPGMIIGANSPVGRKYAEKDHISFVRADREISSGDYGLYTKTDTQMRWWTIEVKFNADSDDLLGVHNNKQGIEFVRTDDSDIEDQFNPHTASLQQARHKCWIELTKKITEARIAVWNQVRKQGKEWDARFIAGTKGTTGGTVLPPLPTSTVTTTNASLTTDGIRTSQFTELERTALENRLTEKFPNVPREDVLRAVKQFDDRKVRGCILYCASESDSLWSLTSVYDFLIVLVNTNHEFYSRIMLPLRTRGFETALSSIELFLSSLAWEEKEHFRSTDDRKNVIEQFRSYVGLHLNRYLADNQIAIHESDFVIGASNGDTIDTDSQT